MRPRSCGAAKAPAGVRDDRPCACHPWAARRRVPLGVEHVVGPQRRSRPSPSAPTTTSSSAARTSSRRSSASIPATGVVILTDMFGGTPSNLAISVMSQPKVEVLAGINLPMLIKLAKVRETCPLQDGGRRRPGGRPQILHHRQPRAQRQMNDPAEADGNSPRLAAARRRARARDRQQERPARPRLGQIRADRRAVRRRRSPSPAAQRNASAAPRSWA